MILLLKIQCNLYVTMISANIQRIFTLTKENSSRAYWITTLTLLLVACLFSVKTILLWHHSYLIIFSRNMKLPSFSAKSKMSMRNQVRPLKSLNIYSIIANCMQPHQLQHPCDTWNCQWLSKMMLSCTKIGG